MTEFRAFANRLRRRDFVRHGLLIFGALMAANLLMFLFYSLVSRVVGVEQYGIVTSLISGILLLAIGPASVAATIVARLAADLRAVADVAKLRRLGDVITNTTAVVGALAFGVIVVAAAPIAQYLHLSSTRPVILTGISLAFSYAIPVQRGVLQGVEDFQGFAISNVIECGTKFIASPLLGSRFGMDGVLIGFCIGTATPWLYNVIVLRSLGPTAARLKFNLRRIVVTSTNIGIAVLAVNALMFYDVILVRHYFSPVTAGLYGASALIGRAVYAVIAFIPTIVLPKASLRHSVGQSTKSLLAAAMATGAAIVAAALVTVTIAPRLVVSILAGHAFAGAAAFELPYVFAAGALSLANVVVMYNVGLHRFDFVAPLAIVAVVEIVCVVTWHATIFGVLSILCVGHFLSLVAMLYRGDVAKPANLAAAVAGG